MTVSHSILAWSTSYSVLALFEIGIYLRNKFWNWGNMFYFTHKISGVILFYFFCCIKLSFHLISIFFSLEDFLYHTSWLCWGWAFSPCVWRTCCFVLCWKMVFLGIEFQGGSCFISVLEGPASVVFQLECFQRQPAINPVLVFLCGVDPALLSAPII